MHNSNVAVMNGEQEQDADDDSVDGILLDHPQVPGRKRVSVAAVASVMANVIHVHGCDRSV